MASVKANPKIANLNKSSFRVGCRLRKKSGRKKPTLFPNLHPLNLIVKQIFTIITF
jgi:hypothetical protein